MAQRNFRVVYLFNISGNVTFCHFYTRFKMVNSSHRCSLMSIYCISLSHKMNIMINIRSWLEKTGMLLCMMESWRMEALHLLGWLYAFTSSSSSFVETVSADSDASLKMLNQRIQAIIRIYNFTNVMLWYCYGGGERKRERVVLYWTFAQISSWTSSWPLLWTT